MLENRKVHIRYKLVSTTVFNVLWFTTIFIQHRYIDIKKLHTEISSLTRIIHEKPASRSSRASFLQKKMVHKKVHKTEGLRWTKIVKSVIRS